MLDDVFFETPSSKSLSEQFEKLTNIGDREAQLEFFNILSKYGLLKSITSEEEQLNCLNQLISIGYACKNHALLLSMGAQYFAIASVLKNISDNHLQNNIKKEIVFGDKIGAFAATEMEAGSDVMAMKTYYEHQNGEFVLNGSKCYITNATTADYIFVFATKNPKLYDRGLSLFVVPSNTSGITITPLETEKTLKYSGLGNIVFDNVMLNENALVGKECHAAVIFHTALKMERAHILIPHIGTMLRWYHQCVKNIKSRVQFKKPLYEYQYIADKIIDIHERIKVSYLLAEDIFQKNNICDISSSLIKNYISDSLQITHVHALNILGASGFFGENKLSEELTDSFLTSIYSGTREIQKNIILNAIIDGG